MVEQLQVNVPLVLYGGTGILEKSLREAIDCGICKVNITTQFIHVFARGYADAYHGLKDAINVETAFALARDKAQALVEEKISAFLNR